MRILYLCPDLGIPVLGRKGASVHVRELVAALGRAGHTVVVATPQLNKSPWEEPAEVEASLMHLPPGPETVAAVLAMKTFNETLGTENSLPGELRRILHDQEWGLRLRRRFENHRPDFIYERASLYATAGASLARALDVPLILELNSPIAVEQTTYRATGLGELASRAERWTVTRADAVLTVSELLKDYAVSLGAEPGRVHVVPNGVDAGRFYPGGPERGLRERWGLGEGPVLGFVGGLRPWHGVEVLPALLERLKRAHPDARLVVAGDGPLRKELERDAGERGMRESVVFTGSLPHEDVAPLIRLFDVALAPYPRPDHDFYFSPLKLFEYMACGVPVVAAALGQIPEVVRDGETGLLYPPDDRDALASACDRLLSDPDLRRRIGSAAAKEVHNRYTWDKNAERVAAVATDLISARRAGP
ncbi:glycosyltransferase [Rubrobacter tropicus]|uniref:Glycosyltransferase n=1 Tax=Rubrobacter tropicus TaxID=2653851 RepID=A0A6G8Q7R5_9ACTN|nr:glycosyltransferase family 4 protein [Rubrobacter tropicus]QIN82493.1 glycosyltransferase [Rubrobacter tropicus]